MFAERLHFVLQTSRRAGRPPDSRRDAGATLLLLKFPVSDSVKWPAIAAAAAIIGLTRCVRPPRPWRPSKLRLLVEAQRSPGCRMSGFMPRHIEHPDSRHSKPASWKILSRPSCSAACFTACDPGTTMARTFAFT